jgi:hypothetical protein
VRVRGSAVSYKLIQSLRRQVGQVESWRDNVVFPHWGLDESIGPFDRLSGGKDVEIGLQESQINQRRIEGIVALESNRTTCDSFNE